MAIPFEVDNIESVDESLRGLYAPVDPEKTEGVHRLAVEGIKAPEGKPDPRVKEFRENNIRLAKENDTMKTALSAFEGIDPQQVKGLLSKFQAEEEQNILKNGGDVEQIFENRLKPVRERFQSEIAAKDRVIVEERRQREELGQRFANQQMDVLVQQALGKAQVALVNPEAMRDLSSRCREAFTLNADYEPVPDEKVIGGYNKNGELKSLSDFIGVDLQLQAPYLFRRARGGGSTGGSDDAGTGVRTVARTQENMAKYVEEIAAGKIVLASR